jgi:hypothetical protein
VRGGKMILSKGTIHCLGQRVKERGERIGHVSVCGVHIFDWLAGPVIRLGIAIRDSVSNCPVREM